MGKSKLTNVNNLREMLCEEIEELRKDNSNSTPAKLNAIVNASGKVLATVKMQLEYAKLVGKTPGIDFVALSNSLAIEGKPQPQGDSQG
jgi:hypothetical protein